mmetsp:Transcript_124114/g.397224  ORF Transcript_124114/g.397224 Transcript_124114/m.397224 type:complete len:217 (+) Transcript_124114:424-1074(+)
MGNLVGMRRLQRRELPPQVVGLRPDLCELPLRLRMRAPKLRVGLGVVVHLHPLAGVLSMLLPGNVQVLLEPARLLEDRVRQPAPTALLALVALVNMRWELEHPPPREAQLGRQHSPAGAKIEPGIRRVFPRPAARDTSGGGGRASAAEGSRRGLHDGALGPRPPRATRGSAGDRRRFGAQGPRAGLASAALVRGGAGRRRPRSRRHVRRTSAGPLA